MSRIRRASKRMRIEMEKSGQQKKINTLDLLLDVKYPRGGVCSLPALTAKDYNIIITRDDIDNWEIYRYLERVRQHYKHPYVLFG